MIAHRPVAHIGDLGLVARHAVIEIARHDVVEAEESSLSPLVGRGDEIDLLLRRWARATCRAAGAWPDRCG
jgi:hypothetical protein